MKIKRAATPKPRPLSIGLTGLPPKASQEYVAILAGLKGTLGSTSKTRRLSRSMGLTSGAGAAWAVRYVLAFLERAEEIEAAPVIPAGCYKRLADLCGPGPRDADFLDLRSCVVANASARAALARDVMHGVFGGAVPGQSQAGGSR
jgi:hypothetical protein